MSGFQCPSNGYPIFWDMEPVDWDAPDGEYRVSAGPEDLEEVLNGHYPDEQEEHRAEYEALYQEAEALTKKMDGRVFPGHQEVLDAWVALGVSRFDL